MSTRLTSEQLEHYHEHGYTVTPAIFPRGELATINQELDRMPSLYRFLPGSHCHGRKWSTVEDPAPSTVKQTACLFRTADEVLPLTQNH